MHNNQYQPASLFGETPTPMQKLTVVDYDPNTYLDEFEKEAQTLIQKEITADTFFEIIKAAYPEPDKDVKGSLTKWTNKVDTLWDIYQGDTVAQAGIMNTAWGAYNTLTERLDWFRNPRGGNAEGVLAAASGFDAATNAEKNRLLKVVKAVAFA